MPCISDVHTLFHAECIRRCATCTITLQPAGHIFPAALANKLTEFQQSQPCKRICALVGAAAELALEVLPAGSARQALAQPVSHLQHQKGPPLHVWYYDLPDDAAFGAAPAGRCTRNRGQTKALTGLKGQADLAW